MSQALYCGLKTITKCVMGVLMCTLLASCSVPASSVGRMRAAGPGEALISLYMETQGNCGKKIAFTLRNIEVLQGDVWLPFETVPQKADSRRLQNAQQLLGVTVLPAGHYSSLRFQISEVRGSRGGEVPDQVVTLPFSKEVNLQEGDSSCLFLQWNLDDCLNSAGQFVPEFSVRGQSPALGVDQLFVACDDIGTLYVIRADRDFVVASYGLKGALGGSYFDTRRTLLYVLNSVGRQLMVLEPETGHVVDRISLPLVVEPWFMAVSSDENFAFVTDSRTSRVLKVDLREGAVVSEVKVGYRPERISFFDDAGTNRLAVSSPDSQKVLVLNAENLAPVLELSVGIDPADTFFLDGLLYVAESGSQTVSSYDLRTGRSVARIAVGLAPVALVQNQKGQIYVADYGDDSLSLISPSQHSAFRRIGIGRGPFHLTFSDRRKVVYVGNRGDRSISVIDTASEKVKRVVPLGGTPFSMAIWE